VRDCLLGTAVDRDASGAVSVNEIEQCAQQIINTSLKPFPDLKPHHLTITGNRNIVPVAVVRPAVVAVVPAPAPAPAPAPPVATPPSPPAVTTQVTPPAPALTLPPVPPPVAALPAPPPPVAPITPVAPPVPPALASLATLREIAAQSNPRRKVEVTLSRASLKIGGDPLALKLKSSRDGYAYLVLLGSDSKSFYVLFPNALDADNRIKANQTLSLPRPA
jgi:hypothetical protein